MAEQRPRRRTRRAIAYIAGAGVAIVIGAFLFIYFVLFPTSSPKPFKLTPLTSTSTTTAASPTTASTGTVASGLSGSWKIAAGSQAGYRVREKLAFLPAQSDAVGRTSQVTGSATFSQSAAGVAIRTASFDVNVLSLKSDRSQRDEKIREIGLESSRFPTATFTLSAPVTLPLTVLHGSIARVDVTGVFDIHGVSKRETLPVEMSVSGSLVQAVGAITFPWGEFGMTAPSVGGFVNVTEHATMEFDLRLERA